MFDFNCVSLTQTNKAQKTQTQSNYLPLGSYSYNIYLSGHGLPTLTTQGPPFSPPPFYSSMSAQDTLNALMAGRAIALGEESARREAVAAVAPKPRKDHGFPLGCDRLSCPFGLLAWNGKVPTPEILSCSRCGEGRFCSKDCQRLDWVAGHKTFCAHLRPPPRPLRLLQRLVPEDVLAPIFPKNWNEVVMGKKVASPASMNVALGGKGGDKKDGAALDALLHRLNPSRLILVALHCWAHVGSGSGESRMPDATLLEYDVSSEGGGLSGEALLASCYEVMPYVFREEDRLAKGVRYEPSTGSPKLGRPCPRRIAAVSGAEVDRNSIVTKEGYMSRMGMGVVMMGPPRYRWETMGPFCCGEMALEDMSIASLYFFHPPTWPKGWYAVTIIYKA